MCVFTEIGQIRAVRPSIRAMLAMFEPYALPIAIPGFPCIDENVATTISGAEVPKPTITIPISKGDILKCRATDAVLSIKRSALHINISNPKISAKEDSIIILSKFWSYYLISIYPESILVDLVLDCSEITISSLYIYKLYHGLMTPEISNIL